MISGEPVKYPVHPENGIIPRMLLNISDLPAIFKTSYYLQINAKFKCFFKIVIMQLIESFKYLDITPSNIILL
jgi:hypothetical protein